MQRESRHGGLCRWIKAAEPPPDDRFLTGEPSNTVRARVPWQAQPYMMSGKYASRGLLRCLETFVWCEMRCLCWERVMCERKAKKDAPADVVSRAACMSRAPSADASRLALSGWGRPAWSLASTLFRPFMNHFSYIWLIFRPSAAVTIQKVFLVFGFWFVMPPHSYAPRVCPPFKGFPLLRKLPHNIGSMDRQATRVVYVVLNR